MSERPTSYWEHPLPDAPAAVELPRDVDVLIVGAGFMGSWLARFVSEARPERSVLVVERDVFGLGASTRNAGFLTCGHVTEMMSDAAEVGDDVVLRSFDLRRRGVALVREALGDALDAPCGSFDADPLDDAKRAFAERLNERAGCEVYVERDVACAGETAPRLVNVEDGGLHPVEVLTAVRAAARGVGWSFETSVARVADGEATLVRDGVEHVLRYDRAFVCTNAATSSLVADTDIEPGRGQVIVTSPLDGCATDPLLGYRDAGYDYFRRVGDRFLLGGGRHRFREAEAVFDVRPTAAVRDYLETVARELIGHDRWTVEHHWAGVMGFPGGQHLGRSTRRPLDDRTELLAGFGGMGVACTPTVARDVADGL